MEYYATKEHKHVREQLKGLRVFLLEIAFLHKKNTSQIQCLSMIVVVVVVGVVVEVVVVVVVVI